MKSELRAATVKVAKDEAMEDDESVASPAGPSSAGTSSLRSAESREAPASPPTTVTFALDPPAPQRAHDQSHVPDDMKPPDSAHLPQSDCCRHVYDESGGTSVHGFSGSTSDRTYLL